MIFLQKKVRLLSQFESRDAYVSFPIVRIRRRAGGGFELDSSFFAPSLSTGASPGMQAMLESLLTQIHVKIETLYGRHRQVSDDVFEAQSVDIASHLMLNTITGAAASLSHSLRYRPHHPEFVFDKLSALAGALLAISLATPSTPFPPTTMRTPRPASSSSMPSSATWIEVTMSSRYHVIALTRDAACPFRHGAVFSADLVDDKSLLGIAVSAEMPALELVGAVPVRFKISAPANIASIAQHAL